MLVENLSEVGSKPRKKDEMKKSSQTCVFRLVCQDSPTIHHPHPFPTFTHNSQAFPIHFPRYHVATVRKFCVATGYSRIAKKHKTKIILTIS